MPNVTKLFFFVEQNCRAEGIQGCVCVSKDEIRKRRYENVTLSEQICSNMYGLKAVFNLDSNFLLNWFL